MWRITLKAKVTDLNRHTLILDSPDGTESLNPFYVVPTCARMLKQIEIFKKDRPSPAKAINNVYDPRETSEPSCNRSCVNSSTDPHTGWQGLEVGRRPRRTNPPI